MSPSMLLSALHTSISYPSWKNAPGSSRETLRPYVAFHAALRSAHINFLSKLEERTKQLLRQHLDSATSEFAVNLLASIPDGVGEGREDGGAYNADDVHDSDQQGALTGHRTIPETPSPSSLLDASRAKPPPGGPGRMLDNSPSKRAPKSLRANDGFGGGRGGDSYEDVIRRAESLFRKIRHSVAQQGVPTTLKAAFLGPVETSMALEVSLELFSKTDSDFMAMFTAASVLAHLQAKRDSLQKRADSLVKLRNDFQELSRIL
eukprot:gene23672-9207_t